MTPIYVVCTGPNYTPDHVKRFERQLKEHTSIEFKVHCYTTYDKDLFDDSIEVLPLAKDIGWRQWHKVDFFNMAPVGQVCFISDLDWTFVGDVTDIFSAPVSSGELVAPHRWWTRGKGRGYTINGGLYKFIGGDHKYIPDTFYQDTEYWMMKYIRMRLALPPVNGEQNFVDQMLRVNGGTIKYFEPQDAFGRVPPDHEHAIEYNLLYSSTFGEDWLWMGGEFNPKVRMIQSIV